MFDIGWSEMLVIAVVLIVVVGPKDLPKMLRTFGKTTAKLRAMAGDFQRQFNEALKEAELDDVKKSVDELRSLNPASTIRKHLNPFEQAASDVRAGLDTLKSPAAKPAEPAASVVPAAASTDAAAQPAEPASPVAHAAEPLKNGATAMPDVTGPEAMPPAPVMMPLNGAAPAAPVAAAAVAQASPSGEAAPAKPKKAAVRKTPAKAAATKAANSKPRAVVAEKAEAGAVKSAPARKRAAKAADRNTKANAS